MNASLSALVGSLPFFPRRLLHVSCSVFAYGYDAMRVEMQGGDFQILLETGLLMLWQVLDW